MIATPTNSCTCFKSIFTAPAQHKRLLFIIVLLILFYSCAGKNVKNKNFDYFVFSQRWLPTACIEYVEHSSRPLWCVLPKEYEFWSIHGLWPTQNNHLGPFFCNGSMPFDENKLHPIESDLKSYWPNIEGGKDVSSLWQHEWEKHGTCAAQLEALNTEIKYFNKTLNLFKTDNINDLFRINSIAPGCNGLLVSDLFQIIRGKFGKLPQIHCIHEVKTNQPFLSEIRLCYNKNLELMDCGKINGNKFYGMVYVPNGLTNCPQNTKIIYPSNIHVQGDEKDLSDIHTKNRDFYNVLLDVLKILRFLMWASI